MGWFWAASNPSPSTLVAPHPMPTGSNATPPPSCPMHNAALPPKQPDSVSSSAPQACPYTPPDKGASTGISSKSSAISKLNPLNWMPSNISNTPAPQQDYNLPLQRETSTIPKGDGSGNWEYPSPQQMYNAMLRKGSEDIPVDAVESMVAVHNYLNEGAWAEILEWERRFGRGIMRGIVESQRGEAGSVHGAMSDANWDEKDVPVPQLVRFMGRPKDLTPKARMLQAAGWAFPSRFSQEPPFDRHDWTVKRTLPDGASREVRYVIDYYSGPPEPDGMPVFYLDVRPAVDTPAAAAARMARWGGDIWYRGTGGAARDNMA